MRKQLVISTVLLVLSISANVPTFAQSTHQNILAATRNEDKAKDQSIRKLLEVTGVKNLYKLMTAQIIANFKAQYPKVPAKFWNTIAEEIKPDELLEEIIPIYKKYYTNQDLKQLLAFYQSPIGKKTVHVLPQLTRESLQVGLKFGQKVGQRVSDKLNTEGYKPSPSNP